MHQTFRCILLHFGYVPGVTLLRRASPQRASLIAITQSRMAKGSSRLRRYRPRPATMNVQMPAVAKVLPISTTAQNAEGRRATPANKATSRKVTCRIVKRSTDSTFAAISSRATMGRAAFAATGAAAAAARTCRA